MTPEAIEKVREKARLRWADPAFKARVSAAMRGKSRSEESRAKMSASKAGRTRAPHSEETKAKMRAKHLGKVLSPEHRAKLSLATTGRPGYWLGRSSGGMSGKRHSPDAIERIRATNVQTAAASRRPVWRRHEYAGLAFRSSWERRAATALDSLGVRWQYEPKAFRFGSEFSYTPDFYLPDDGAYWEVKGYMCHRSRRAVERFRRDYPDVPLVVVNKQCLQALEAAAQKGR